MEEVFISKISTALSLSSRSVRNTAQLLGEGATIPFIARYRKEATGALDELAIAHIKEQLKKLQELENRRESILKSIDQQGQLTDALRQRIAEASDMVRLEDLYLPYKRKKKTRASTAREKGLEPLAQLIFQQNTTDLSQQALAYINEEVPSLEDALQGARDIIAEWINEDQRARQKMRQLYGRSAILQSKVARGKATEGQKYKDYFEFAAPLKNCPSHRILAIRRGEEEGILRVSIGPEEEEAIWQLEKIFVRGPGEATLQLKEALRDSYKRLLASSIASEFRLQAKESADTEAISVFAENLRQLLLAPPLGQKRVMAIDPGYRTGCKTVCLDESGNLVHNTAIYPHPPQNDKAGSIQQIKQLANRFQIQAIAVGNGTAGRETLALCKEIDFSPTVEVFMVNESGASIYSASEIAREEFPHHDVTVRGAVSIGRRLMDPLAELVKIDPKSIGVGQYQHDVNQPRLRESLQQVVESCVNSVGINLNTASKHLLTFVSGLGPALAQNIVDYRSENGPFRSRKDLLSVARMGAKAFEQCAGFLRIHNSSNPLDNTAVHPESYAVVRQMTKDLNCSIQQLIENEDLRKNIPLEKYITPERGMPTLKDIVAELAKPGLDPRGQASAFAFSEQIKNMEDLQIGMVLPGLITNITNFGAFVDIGVKQDGLVHISELANKFVKNPADVVKLNQQVQVKVLELDMARKRINLSIKQA